MIDIVSMLYSQIPKYSDKKILFKDLVRTCWCSIQNIDDKIQAIVVEK